MKLYTYIERCALDSRIKKRILKELSYRTKKPVRQYRISGNTMFMVCPSCNSDIEVDYSAFCTVCGRKLSWYGHIKHREKV